MLVAGNMRRALPTVGRRAMSSAPSVKPACPNFSSGPCAKRPGYSLQGLADAPLGRSHRAKIGKSKLAGAIDQTRELLAPAGLPDDYHIGIVPGSDTGAVEMAMWSLVRARLLCIVGTHVTRDALTRVLCVRARARTAWTEARHRGAL